MLFIDASVVVAILADEADAGLLIDRLEADGGPFYVSPIVRMEASLSLARRMAEAAGPDRPATPDMLARARAAVDQFVADIDAVEVDVSGEIGTAALDATQRFGKLVNHPARLNMGDCLSYACARTLGSRIAYKGDDFARTDLGW